jgi:hypothetical protein
LLTKRRTVRYAYAFRHDELKAVAPPKPSRQRAAPAAPAGDEGFWVNVGIDPIRIITSSGTVYTLRCYLDDAPIFLGYRGRIMVFRSTGALKSYLVHDHESDMASLSTYSDVRSAAIDGTMRVEVTDENVYMITGLGDDIADGPDQVDPEQLELAVELLSDVGQYVGDQFVEDFLRKGQPLGDLVERVLVPNYLPARRLSFADAASQWTQLEDFLESRLRTR